jgi:hypothetical protein
MNRIDQFIERMERITPYWFAPMFWSLEACFAIQTSDWSLRQHWSTMAAIGLVTVPLALILMFPLLLLTIALWAVLIPLLLIYVLARMVSKLFGVDL